MENGGSTVSHMRQGAGDIAQDVQDRIEELRGYAEDAGEIVRNFARARPVAAIAIAAGLGFVLGRLMSRT
ncbi:hypothetical protein [Anaeromyxobacter sp. SG17]|uniref:glycine zipper domain-containing protein n=1 Tax=Anaeromyxobacter sp. SG17 TaxID=2925405 RepID=UPI001F590427|nr:hypothetical protein [Anaeromyxobacter sp. SG17]